MFTKCILYSKKGYWVKSYGTGSVVKLPGKAANQPNVYPFGTTYEDMYQDLMKKDPHLYLACLVKLLYARPILWFVV